MGDSGECAGTCGREAATSQSSRCPHSSGAHEVRCPPTQRAHDTGPDRGGDRHVPMCVSGAACWAQHAPRRMPGLTAGGVGADDGEAGIAEVLQGGTLRGVSPQQRQDGLPEDSKLLPCVHSDVSGIPGQRGEAKQLRCDLQACWGPWLRCRRRERGGGAAKEAGSAATCSRARHADRDVHA